MYSISLRWLQPVAFWQWHCRRLGRRRLVAWSFGPTSRQLKCPHEWPLEHATSGTTTINTSTINRQMALETTKYIWYRGVHTCMSAREEERSHERSNKRHLGTPAIEHLPFKQWTIKNSRFSWSWSWNWNWMQPGKMLISRSINPQCGCQLQMQGTHWSPGGAERRQRFSDREKRRRGGGVGV